MNSETPIIWTEGLMGAGKTKFVKKIAELLGFFALEEPVDTNFYLGEFYKDQPKYAFGMQMLLLHHRYAMKQAAAFLAARCIYPGIILDRSIAGDKTFAGMHRDAGNINALDWRCYDFAYRMMARTIQPPTLMIYLRVQPETAFARMQERAREEEARVPLAYLQALYGHYENLIYDIKHGSSPWGRQMVVHEIIYDKGVHEEDEWRIIAKSISDICDRQRRA